MNQIFNFSEIEKCEKAIRKTWSEFREALTKGLFKFNEIDKAKEYTFLKTYDDLFCQHAGIHHKAITIKKLDGLFVGRGTILNETEILDYERFIPKKEFIGEDNRFSPSGIEWLYLAIGNENSIHQCAQAECKAKVGNRFGFCHFAFDDSCLDLKLVNLTVADDISYSELNSRLEEYGQAQIKKVKALGFIPRFNVDKEEFQRLFTEWSVYTYTKLLSEQIFEPLSNVDDKSAMYAPFQAMAQYYISLGYSGIIYRSTVSNYGRNIVLFDKNIAHPVGEIEDYTVS